VPLQFACPYCASKVGVLSAGWQNQRNQQTRHCPQCQKEVVVLFSGLRLLCGVCSSLLLVWLSIKTEIEPIKWLAYVSNIWAFSSLMYLDKSDKSTRTQVLEMNKQFDVIVIGAGPGGYIAAIRAAQLG
jgi:ribosomal protein S27AE